MINYENSIVLSGEINEIISPLNQIGIELFIFVRILNDNTRLTLSNHSSWLDMFFKNALSNKYDREIFQRKYQKTKYSLWISDPTNKIIQDSNKFFGISNGIDISYAGENYTDVFVYGAHNASSQINDFYINNLELLDNVRSYFLDKTSNLFKKINKKCYIPLSSPNSKDLLTSKDLSATATSISNQVRTQRYYLEGEFSEMYLTRQETLCSSKLLEGKTAKEIGEVMNLTKRTVESYIENLKIKLNCSKKSDLIGTLIQAGLR